MDDVALILDTARQRLRGSPKERLGVHADQRRILGITRAPRILPVAEAWHLGVLLIGDEGLAATGRILRAHTEVRRGFTAESQRERAGWEAAARRGGFGEGETFHLDWTPIELDDVVSGEDTRTVLLRDGRAYVRWSASGALRLLGDYIDELISLR